MYNMNMTLFTTRILSDEQIASRFFEILSSCPLSPQKIGLYEPIRRSYSKEEAVRLWMSKDKVPRGYAGSMMGRSVDPKMVFTVSYREFPENPMYNHIFFLFDKRTFHNLKQQFLLCFREIIDLIQADYGYITNEQPEKRQHVTGTLQDRMPGVFWCNYYGNRFVSFFGEEVITSFPWYKQNKLGDGIITFLEENPDQLENDDTRENLAKEHLGLESFGDLELYRSDPFKTQYRKVPRL